MEMDLGMRATASAPADDERELILQARREPQAFAVLYRRYYSGIAGYIFRRVGDTHVTEDLVADVFVAALGHLTQYHHRGLPFGTWLYRIATNRVNRWARRERARLVQSLVIDPPVEPASTDSKARAEHARLSLLALKPKYQAVLALHYLEGMPVTEVARTLGCREGTVKSRLARGREQLRQRLEQRRSRS